MRSPVCGFVSSRVDILIRQLSKNDTNIRRLLIGQTPNITTERRQGGCRGESFDTFVPSTERTNALASLGGCSRRSCAESSSFRSRGKASRRERNQPVREQIEENNGASSFRSDAVRLLSMDVRGSFVRIMITLFISRYRSRNFRLFTRTG